ncbi:hypothetical protein [Caloramator sp. Dgby_cultured_2]|uniref:hypothetical protein n=1 Tax=Caloramator sp. Dgby_cultured_2 TaxID=3029174 RepID=UPI00237E24F8|nr:hypothetical protein [Caloramator sp. Dgby_cultured_2]WDU83931.1 hypothetical protein PWK10_05495 [Caloramator sp. Dgby_cultured_2]
MKLKTPEGIIRIPNLLNTVVRWTKTNIPPKLMVYYAYKAIGMHADSIESETLKGNLNIFRGFHILFTMRIAIKSFYHILKRIMSLK